MIDAVASAGSFLDGGGSKPLQRAAIPLLDDDARRRRDAARSTTAFREKRDRMLAGLERLGVAHRPRARRHVLRLGQRRRPAAAAQRRHGLLPRRARAARSSPCPASSSTSTPASAAAQRPRASARYVRFSFGPSHGRRWRRRWSGWRRSCCATPRARPSSGSGPVPKRTPGRLPWWRALPEKSRHTPRSQTAARKLHVGRARAARDFVPPTHHSPHLRSIRMTMMKWNSGGPSTGCRADGVAD